MKFPLKYKSFNFSFTGSILISVLLDGSIEEMNVLLSFLLFPLHSLIAQVIPIHSVIPKHY